MQEQQRQDKKYLFRCKTTEAYVIKILIDLLHNLLKTACFEITPEGIFLRMMDANKHTLFDIFLDSAKFNVFSFSPSIPLGVINFGINLQYFYKMIRSIKKQDQIVFFIEESKQHELGIEVIPKHLFRITTSFIKIQNIQNLGIELPEEGYERAKPVLVSSSEFIKMWKDIFHMSDVVHVCSYQFSILFYCIMGSVYSKYVLLGEPKEEEQKTKSCLFEASFLEEHEETFDTEELLRISKVSGLSPTMNITCIKDCPLKIQTQIGNLGRLRIYIKNRNQTQNDERN